MFDIDAELKKLPQKPGVYIMKDATDKIIYVGKAINLRNRVRQYFQPSSAQNNKVMSMVPNIAEFEYIVTDNELEALILECNLIKKHRPKYNVMLKDDKTYPFLKLTINEAFPRLFVTRNHAKDRAKYFGPFTSKQALDEVVDVVNKIWRLRRCQKKLSQQPVKERPCLNYYIGQCHAPCNLLINKEEYGKMVQEVISFLNGKSGDVVKKMEAEMLEYSENLEFEKAAELRDKINSVKRLDEKQKIEGDPGDDKDVIAFDTKDDNALVQIFFIRSGKMTGREHFMMSGTNSLSKEEIMTEFIKQFYSDTTFIPKEIVVEADIFDKATIVDYLSKLKGANVTITLPQRGEKLHLVEMASKNAKLSLEQFGEKIKRETEKTVGALLELKQALDLRQDIDLNRIEAYDISNIQGFESVGSMIVFEKGKPKRSDYRKFKIKTVRGADDVKSMEEVLTRRLMRYKMETESGEAMPKFATLPDAIFIDGGAGQVNAALKVLRKMNMFMPVCGMVKDDRHRTRGLLYNDKEILFPANSEGFKLVTRIQDEVHRFAIEYHRKLREKTQVRSLLDDIKGVGNTRRKALIKHFGDIEGIRDASIEELTEVKTMNALSAKAVYDFFHTIPEIE